MIKRAFDITCASAGLIITAPITLTACFTMAVANRSHPIFKQKRIGIDKKLFTMYKIKSMKDTTDTNGNPAPEEQRTTFLGKIFRKTKIDELPQLINVLKGDMSIVGPRPCLPRETILSQDYKRHTVKPGITGLHQINGGSNLSSERCLELDHKYVDTHSVIRDLWICLQTPYKIVKQLNTPHYRVRRGTETLSLKNE